jgi:hypothetical protein
MAESIVPVGERGDVHVDRLQLPVRRKHGGDRQQAERRKSSALRDEVQDMLEAPERVGGRRGNEQDLHFSSALAGGPTIIATKRPRVAVKIRAPFDSDQDRGRALC